MPQTHMAATAHNDGHVLLFLVIAVFLQFVHASSTESISTDVLTNTTVVVNCSRIAAEAAVGTRSAVVLQSSTLYVLNCTEAQPAFLDFTSNGDGGDGDLHNVVVHASGGNILPRLNVSASSQNGSSGTLHSAVSNVSLRMFNVHVTEEVVVGTRPMFLVKGGRSIMNFSAVLENVSLRLAWFEPLESLFVVGPPSPAGTTSGLAPPTMSEVSFTVVSSVMELRSTNSSIRYADRAILLLIQQAAHNASAVAASLRDSVIRYRGTLGNFVLKVASDPVTTASVDGYRLDLRNVTAHMDLVQDDARRSSDVDEKAGDTSALCHIDLYRVQNVVIVVSDSVWIASTPEWGSTLRVSDELFLIILRARARGISMSRNVSIHVSNATATVRSRLTAALISVTVAECNALHVRVVHVVVNMTAWGTVNALDTSRTATVIYVSQHAVPIDATIVIEGAVAQLVATATTRCTRLLISAIRSVCEDAVNVADT